MFIEELVEIRLENKTDAGLIKALFVTVRFHGRTMLTVQHLLLSVSFWRAYSII